MPDQSEPITTRHPAWPWCNITFEQRAYPALILRWERHPNAQGYYSWSARVTYLDGDEHKTALIPASRVTRVG